LLLWLIVGGVLLLLILANHHTEITHEKKYEIAVNQRVPANELAVFDGIDVRHTVWLTTHYRECCYLPYYLFIPYNNMTAHTAGRYEQREDFVRQIAAIDDPAVVAFALRKNKYDAVDYVYLPRDDKTGGFKMILYKSAYNQKGVVNDIPFAVNFADAPDYFERHRSHDIFKVKLPSDELAVRRILSADYQELKKHIR